MSTHATRPTPLHVDPRAAALMARLTNLHGWPSLPSCLTMALSVALMMAAAMAWFIHDYFNYIFVPSFVEIMAPPASLISSMGLAATPLVAGAVAVTMTSADIVLGQREMLALTNIPGRVVFQGYGLAALHRLRIPLAVLLGLMPLIAVPSTLLLIPYSAAGPFTPVWLIPWPELAARVVPMAGIALGAYGMSLPAAVIGVQQAFRSASRAAALLRTCGVTAALMLVPLSGALFIVGRSLLSVDINLSPAELMLRLALSMVIALAPYLVGWAYLTTERRLS